jgi:hypothetical protein
MNDFTARGLGEEAFCCVMTNYLCKLPNDDKHVPWHQDAVYWPFRTSRIVQLYRPRARGG